MLRRTAPLFFAMLALSCSESGPDLEFAEFDAEIEAFLEETGLEGATAVVVHRDHGVLHARAYGSFTLDRIVLLASASKIISAGVLVHLADQGVVDLDAPISTYLDAYGAYKTDITLAQLLSNSSGMVGLSDDPLYSKYICQYIGGGTLTECGVDIYTVDDASDRVPPDTAFRYGGGQWQLAGAIAEHVTGKTWEELIDEIYRTACGVHTLGYANQYGQAFGAGSPLGYPAFFHGDVDDLWPTLNPNVEGGGYASAPDYARILLMHLRGGRCDHGRVLEEASVARMQTDRIAAYGGTPDPTLPGYGLGWWVSRDEPGVVVDGGAYGAMPMLDVGRGYGVVILLEGTGSQGAQIRRRVKPILDAMFDALAAAP